MMGGVQAKQKGELNVRGRLQFIERSACRVKKDTTENGLSPRDTRNEVDVDLTQIT